MRHLIGIGLAIGLAAAIFFAATWGYLRLLKIPVVNGGASTLPANGGTLLHNANAMEAVAALAGTALLAGIFVAWRRISPLAAGLPGMVLIAWTIVYGFSVRRAVHHIPLRGDAFGTGFEAMLINGLLAAGGLVLIVPLLIPSRWRPAVLVTETPADITVPAQQAEVAEEEKEPVTASSSGTRSFSFAAPWHRTRGYRVDDD
jgi:hypothetical protein